MKRRNHTAFLFLCVLAYQSVILLAIDCSSLATTRRVFAGHYSLIPAARQCLEVSEERNVAVLTIRFVRSRWSPFMWTGASQARCVHGKVRQCRMRSKPGIKRFLSSLSPLTYDCLCTQLLRISKNILGHVTTIDIQTMFQRWLCIASVERNGKGYNFFL